MTLPQSDITKMLAALNEGDRSAFNTLVPLIYQEFRKLAASLLHRKAPEQTLQPTELVHEAYLKLVDQDQVDWRGRTHFFAAGAQAMRHILVDRARRKDRQKHGGGQQRILLDDNLAISTRKDEDILALDDALNRLAELDSRQAKIVELRFFGGLTVKEVAEALGVSHRTVEVDWTMARAWLKRELGE